MRTIQLATNNSFYIPDGSGDPQGWLGEVPSFHAGTFPSVMSLLAANGPMGT